MSKYNNVKTVIDGITFDSKKEAQRYQDLLLLQLAGVVKSSGNLLLSCRRSLLPGPERRSGR